MFEKLKGILGVIHEDFFVLFLPSRTLRYILEVPPRCKEQTLSVSDLDWIVINKFVNILLL